MASGLEHLLSEGIVSEVVGRLKSGKEADVYAVHFGGRVVAAKVYKDRAHRSFKNNALYQEGRSVRNSRSQRAMDRKTSFGQATAESAWKAAEADALYKLHAAEVRVPTPVLFLDGVLLMELVLDEDGQPAPRVIDAPLTVAQANAAYHDMLKQLVRILSCDLIHGDLSPYNVLWAAKGPTIIDFPQTMSASHNSNSEAFFLRDARNILGHFASIDRSLQSRGGDPVEIWRAYVRRELTPDFVPLGRALPPPPRPRPVQPPPRAQNNGHAAPRPQNNGHAGHRPQQNNGHAAPRPQNNGHAGPRPQQNNGHAAPRPQNNGHRGHRPAGGGASLSPPDRSSANGHTHRSSSRRPSPAPEVIVRIARTPRPMADGRLRDDGPKSSSSELRTEDATDRPRSRG